MYYLYGKTRGMEELTDTIAKATTLDRAREKAYALMEQYGNIRVTQKPRFKAVYIYNDVDVIGYVQPNTRYVVSADYVWTTYDRRTGFTRKALSKNGKIRRD